MALLRVGSAKREEKEINCLSILFLYFRTDLDFQSIRRKWESIEQYKNSVEQHLNLMRNTSQLARRCSLVDHDGEQQGI